MYLVLVSIFFRLFWLFSVFYFVFSFFWIFKIKYNLFFPWKLLQYNTTAAFFVCRVCSNFRWLITRLSLRTSERRTLTTCGPTSWPCSRAARTPSFAAWWASTRWRPSAGPSCEPTSGPWWLSGRRVAGTLTRRRVSRSVAGTPFGFRAPSRGASALVFLRIGCFSFPVASFLLSSPLWTLCFPLLPGSDAAVPCAVVKTVDSFSFLHHPVHQRSLEILQRCKDEKYSMRPHISLVKKENLDFHVCNVTLCLAKETLSIDTLTCCFTSIRAITRRWRYFEIQHWIDLSVGWKAPPVHQVYNGTLVDKGPISNLVEPDGSLLLSSAQSMKSIPACIEKVTSRFWFPLGPSPVSLQPIKRPEKKSEMRVISHLCGDWPVFTHQRSHKWTGSCASSQ